MIVDYWIIHRCAVDLPAMYEPHGRYSYWKGINWRALVALLVSVPPTIPGLAAAINASITLGPVRHMFDIAWLYGVSASCFLRVYERLLTRLTQFFTAGVFYWSLSALFPAKETFMPAIILDRDVLPTRASSTDGETDDEKKDGNVSVSVKPEGL